MKLAGNVVIDNVAFDQVIRNLEKVGLPKLGKTVDDAETTYEYVTGLNMFDVTSERVKRLRKEVESKSVKLRQFESTTVEQMWGAELDEIQFALRAK